MSQRDREEAFFEGLGGKKAEAPTPPAKPEPSTPPAPRAVTERNLFENPESHPVLLDAALLKTFGMDWFPWLADTLFYEIEQTFRTSIADINRLKIMAVKTLHIADTFWEEWEIFEKTINALGNIHPMLGVMQPLDVGLLMSGVDIANQVRKEEFSEEVARYAAACFLHDNVHYAPPPCSFTQPYISQPMYRCKDCGKVGSALPPFDGYCDSCTFKFEGEFPLSFKPNEERVKKGHGQNIEYFLTYNPEPTKKRFEELDRMSDPGPSIREVAEDIQAAKLIVATDYMNQRNRQLAEQLTGIRGWLEHA